MELNYKKIPKQIEYLYSEDNYIFICYNNKIYTFSMDTKIYPSTEINFKVSKIRLMPKDTLVIQSLNYLYYKKINDSYLPQSKITFDKVFFSEQKIFILLKNTFYYVKNVNYSIKLRELNFSLEDFIYMKGKFFFLSEGIIYTCTWNTLKDNLTKIEYLSNIGIIGFINNPMGQLALVTEKEVIVNSENIRVFKKPEKCNKTLLTDKYMIFMTESLYIHCIKSGEFIKKFSILGKGCCINYKIKYIFVLAEALFLININ